MKHTILIIALLVSSFAMAQTGVSNADSSKLVTAGTASAIVKPRTSHIVLKPYAVKEIAAIQQRLAELEKALTIEQQISLLLSQRDKMVSTIAQERGFKIENYERYEVKGDTLLLFPKQKEVKGKTQAGPQINSNE